MRLIGLAVVLTVGLAHVPLAVEGQQTGKVYRIAIVHPSAPVADLTVEKGLYFKVLLLELRRLGFVEGKNLVVERRSGEGRTERYQDLAREVARLKPDLIFVATGRLTRAFKAATTTIPIVGVTADPVAELR
jgi:putative ABC transport system substrate-binding protein